VEVPGKIVFDENHSVNLSKGGPASIMHNPLEQFFIPLLTQNITDFYNNSRDVGELNSTLKEMVDGIVQEFFEPEKNGLIPRDN